MAADGLTTIRSSHGPKDTMDRLEAEVKAKGMTAFARIDHAAGAAAVGLSLRPTELLVFGNAKGGTPLMQSIRRSASICPSRHWFGRMPERDMAFFSTIELARQTARARRGGQARQQRHGCYT
jgi:hypothetical protein